VIVLSLLYADVEKESGFLITKLYLTLKDCNGKVIFKSVVGKAERTPALLYRLMNDAINICLDCQYSGLEC
jgi:hypothetical protein